MVTKDEALKLALEALEYIRNIDTEVASQIKYGNAAQIIEEALAQPEPEYVLPGGGYVPPVPLAQPAQRQWVGLTQEQKDSLLLPFGSYGIIDRIEALLKEQNT